MAHDPKAWNQEFETYTRIRYSWTLSAAPEKVLPPLVAFLKQGLSAKWG